MPPQNNVPVPPPVSGAPAPMPPQNTQVPGTGFSMDSLQKNPKMMETIKTFVIYGTVVSLANALIGMAMLMFRWSAGYYGLNISSLIGAVIIGAIGSAIGGVLFFFLYDPIHNWVKTVAFLSSHINSMFSIFWKPFLVGTIISAAFGLLSMFGLGAMMIAATAGYAAASFGQLFIGWIITLVGRIIIYYWFSKQVAAKLEPLYPW